MGYPNISTFLHIRHLHMRPKERTRSSPLFDSDVVLAGASAKYDNPRYDERNCKENHRKQHNYPENKFKADLKGSLPAIKTRNFNLQGKCLGQHPQY